MMIGILALQGDFAKHAEMVQSLGVETVELRMPDDLAGCEGLIIPGGESTVMLRQIDFIGMRQPLLEFAKNKPVFGTCAGLILMSKEIEGSSLKPLELLDIIIERNAYGRQIASFEAGIELLGIDGPLHFPAIFIRAPKIRAHEGIEVLAMFQNEPVLIRQGHFLGAAFHPELTGNPHIHRLFIEMVCSRI